MASGHSSVVEDHIRATLFGNAVGDAIGLLTEFLTKEEAKQEYGDKDELEFHMKIDDDHRRIFPTGDWTDDTDQMILIMQSITQQKGNISPTDFAAKMLFWARKGFPELGDKGGSGIGTTTTFVLRRENFKKEPHEAAKFIWNETGRVAAPNGGLMRTSVLGCYQFEDLKKVKENTLQICKVTHADPRCQASCVAATTAIALMLQQKEKNKDCEFDVSAIISKAYDVAKKLLSNKKERKELKQYLETDDLKELKLDEERKIGYTYKCLGAGFWALKQNNFRQALQAITMEGGDADTNGAIAGALLGCKLGMSKIPSSWFNSLLHREWFEKHIDRFMPLVLPNYERKYKDEDEKKADPQGK